MSNETELSGSACSGSGRAQKADRVSSDRETATDFVNALVGGRFHADCADS